MPLTDHLTTEEAAAIAAILNGDQLARAALGRPTTYTAADVQRIGRIVAEYAPAKTDTVTIPAGTGPVAFTIPSRPASQAAAAGLAAVEQEVLR